MKERLRLFSVIFAIVISSSAALSDTPPITENLEWKGRIVIEFTEAIEHIDVEYNRGIVLLGDDKLDALAYQYNIYSICKFFPSSTKPADPSIRDLSRFYILEFPVEIDLHEVVQAYADQSLIITADPYYVHKLDYTPNDPSFASQWAMAKVEASTAYDYVQGDDRIIIGIVDSGTDTSHFDLKDNLWINPGEDLNGNGIIDYSDWNGIDDDLNGFIDDFMGWNFYDGNNDVNDRVQDGHGSHCAGDATARTDNGIGIASLGWISKIMTAKAGVNDTIYFGIPGINYCADNGADIISLSWGNSSYSPPEAAAIENAYNQGALVFGAAGNENTSALHYPSAYTYCVAVAATDQNDIRASFSNYGTWIDICAPGVDIYSTIPINAYASYDGTSMACPIAAGLAALVWAAKPGWTNEQVKQHIFDTCVDIDAINPSYAGLLGYGRIDAGAAISVLYPNLYYIQLEFDDSGGNGDGRPDPGETVDFLLSIENQSATIGAEDVVVTLECSDADVTILNGTNNLGNIPPGATVTNHSNPLTLSVDAAASPHEVTFTLTRVENGMGLVYVQEITQMIGRPDYLIVDDDGGFTYDEWYTQDLDSLELVHEHWDIADLGESVFEEINLYTNVIWHTSKETDPLTVTEQTAIETYLTNGGRLILTGENIDEQLAGTAFYADVLYAASTDSSGDIIALGIDGDPISEGDLLYLFSAGGAGNSTSPSTIDPVLPAELVYKYTNELGAGIRWFEAGNGSLVYLSFCFEAVSGALNSTPRTEVLSSIFNWFDSIPQTGVESRLNPELPLDYALDQNYPNPFNPATVINFSLPVTNRVKLSIFDLTGRKVKTLVNTVLIAGQHRITYEANKLASGIYLYRIEADDFTTTRKMILLK